MDRRVAADGTLIRRALAPTGAGIEAAVAAASVPPLSGGPGGHGSGAAHAFTIADKGTRIGCVFHQLLSRSVSAVPQRERPHRSGMAARRAAAGGVHAAASRDRAVAGSGRQHGRAGLHRRSLATHCRRNVAPGGSHLTTGLPHSGVRSPPTRHRGDHEIDRPDLHAPCRRRGAPRGRAERRQCALSPRWRWITQRGIRRAHSRH